jgi:leucyl aminopeptidase
VASTRKPAFASAAASTPSLTAEARASVPLSPLDEAGLRLWKKAAAPAARRWVDQVGFTARAGTTCLVPAADGALEQVLLGVGPAVKPFAETDGSAADPWLWAAAAKDLPARTFRIEPAGRAKLDAAAAGAAALGWGLAAYAYERFKTSPRAWQGARLVWPEACDRAHVESTLAATALVRDLINAPASHMGPAELADAARELGRAFGAQVRVIAGEQLLKQNYPAIHAVGRAAALNAQPRLIDLTWGRPRDPKVTLCGKGVCFDTGGLDIKPSGGMKLMKKDMGGAAHVLGIARMIMAAGLRVRLRVLIPAVENSIAGNAMRPLDVVATRKGTTIEIGNTDAEGRVVLADALWEAQSERPEMILDFATLTGAARVALGTELPALFVNDDRLAADFLKAAEATRDPLWRMPLWQPYRRQVKGQVADLTNAPEGGYGGAITAALFLEDFVAREIPWAHIDLMAWNLTSRPGRPAGGEAMGLRATFALIKGRFAG